MDWVRVSFAHLHPIRVDDISDHIRFKIRIRVRPAVDLLAAMVGSRVGVFII